MALRSLRHQTEVAICWLAILLAWNTSPLPAETAQAVPLNAQEEQVARAVTDKIIADIAALKPKYPELARFGSAPELTRIDGGFRYVYRVDKAPIEPNGVPQMRPRPGGCVIYVQFFPGLSSYIPQPPELADYITWWAIGNLGEPIDYRAITSVYGKSHKPGLMDDEEMNTPLNRDLSRVIQHEFQTSFTQLLAQYDLSSAGIGLDVPSLLAAATRELPEETQHPFQTVSRNALTVLRFDKLKPEQLDELRAGIREGRYPPGSLYDALQIIEAQDADHLPECLLDAIKTSLQVEQTGKDTFHMTPFTEFDPWRSDASEARQAALSMCKDNDPRYLPVAALVLSSDTICDNRRGALGYLSRQRSAGARQLVIGALANSFRPVQLEAAQYAGDAKWRAAEPGLRTLLNSPAPSVRAAAVHALKQLGIDVPPPAQPEVAESRQQIGDTLWRLGLNDDDILKDHMLTSINSPLGPAVDSKTITALIDTYAKADPRFPLPLGTAITPAPFLLAAALKLHDEAAARKIDAYLCDQYASDNDILSEAIDALGWDRFAEGLDHFHRGQDPAALASLAQVIALSDVARPFSLLSVYIKQSHELTDFLNRPRTVMTTPEPDPHNTEAYVKFQIAQLKNCDGETPSPAGEKIRQVGLPAVPFLMEALGDRTLTRNFSYWRSYAPERNFIYVGDAVTDILDVIASDYGLTPKGIEFGPLPTGAAKQAKLRALFASLPPHPEMIPPAKRQSPLQYPAGRYFWGDD